MRMVQRTHEPELAPKPHNLPAEEHERGRTVVLVLDEAHLLGIDQLEELRLLTLCRGPGYAEKAQPGGHRPWSGAFRVPASSA